MTLFNFLEWDETLFDNFVLPEGPDTKLAIDTIIEQYGDLEPLGNPEWLKYSIGVWCRRKAWTFKKLWDTLNFEYNPIHNYDREEHLKDKDHRESENLAEGTTENRTAAYNSDSYSPEDWQDNNGKNNLTDDYTHVHDSHMYGNIGVTTTQQMIDQERESVRYDYYLEIANLFRKEFLISVWKGGVEF